MNQKDFIEDKIKEFDNSFPRMFAGSAGQYDKNGDVRPYYNDSVKDFLTSSLNEAWEKAEEENEKKNEECYQKGYEVGREFGEDEGRINERERLLNQPANEHDQEVRRQQREELIKWSEGMPTEFPERESDEYDKGYGDAKEYIITHLKSL